MHMLYTHLKCQMWVRMRAMPLMGGRHFNVTINAPKLCVCEPACIHSVVFSLASLQSCLMWSNGWIWIFYHYIKGARQTDQYGFCPSLFSSDPWAIYLPSEADPWVKFPLVYRSVHLFVPTTSPPSSLYELYRNILHWKPPTHAYASWAPTDSHTTSSHLLASEIQTPCPTIWYSSSTWTMILLLMCYLRERHVHDQSVLLGKT